MNNEKTNYVKCTYYKPNTYCDDIITLANSQAKKYQRKYKQIENILLSLYLIW